jgi:hypothetical protein
VRPKAGFGDAQYLGSLLSDASPVSENQAPPQTGGSQQKPAEDEQCTVHVGGLATFTAPGDPANADEVKAAYEAQLAEVFSAFGQVVSSTVRIRRQLGVVNGAPVLKVSWGVLSYARGADAVAAVRGFQLLDVPEWPDLVVRLVDEGQAAASNGGMSMVVQEREKRGWRGWMKRPRSEDSPRENG